MAKAPTVYPVSADLSALLGAAVDVDAAWAGALMDESLTALEREIAAIRERRIASEAKLRMGGLESLRDFTASNGLLVDIPEDCP